MRPKLEDVAKLANVSKTTVSRVLNNRGYLSQETIDRVYQAVKELKLQPLSRMLQIREQFQWKKSTAQLCRRLDMRILHCCSSVIIHRKLLTSWIF